jgi:glycosyltransferase involved in cell wall biosynthesis
VFKVAVSVIIPTLNEAENLPFVLPRIPAGVHEVILVDGHSTDDTVAVAKRIMPSIRVIQQEGRGKGAALRAGFAAATGAIIVHIDADGSTDPAEIPAFVGALMAGADYAKGSRFLQGGGTDDMTPLRSLGNKAFVTLANVLFRTKFSDITYGYNAFWTQHQYSLATEIDGWANEIVGNIRAARCGLRVVEVASFERPRIAGVAKLETFSAGWTILKAMFAERLRPAQAVHLSPTVVARRVSGLTIGAPMPIDSYRRVIGVPVGAGPADMTMPAFAIHRGPRRGLPEAFAPVALSDDADTLAAEA